VQVLSVCPYCSFKSRTACASRSAALAGATGLPILIGISLPHGVNLRTTPCSLADARHRRREGLFGQYGAIARALRQRQRASPSSRLLHHARPWRRRGHPRPAHVGASHFLEVAACMANSDHRAARAAGRSTPRSAALQEPNPCRSRLPVGRADPVSGSARPDAGLGAAGREPTAWRKPPRGTRVARDDTGPPRRYPAGTAAFALARLPAPGRRGDGPGRSRYHQDV
jgi:hypothetical protein